MVAQKNTAESSNWVRWAVGILITLLVTVNGWVVAYTVGNEHRVTKVETDLSGHIEKAKDDKADVYARLKEQDTNGAKVLQAITSVQVDVAKLTGYFERAKEPTK
jgi:hypothetical protein